MKYRINNKLGEKQQMLKEINSKKVQILLSTYNGEKYLNELLDSLLSQSYKSIEILIRDDGSNDGTIKILKQYEKLSNITVLLGENIGVKNSFFKLLEIADKSFGYYAFCDQDDVWLRDKIKSAVELLESEDKDIPLLYFSKKTIVDEQLNFIGYTIIPRRKLSINNAIIENIASGCTMVINKQLRNKLIGKIPKYTNMHDNWMYKVAAAFGKIIFDKNSYMLYRQHENNVIGEEKRFLKRWIHKIFMDNKVRIKERKATIHIIIQAKEFYDIYYDDLSETNRKLIEDFINKPKSIFKRLIYVLKGKWYKQRVIDNVVFKTLVVLRKPGSEIMEISK